MLGCVTTLKQALRGCRMVPLGSMRYVAVAEAEFAARCLPRGLTQHSFREVSFVSFNRKDDMAVEFVARAFGLKRVSLHQLFVPSTEGQLRAVEAGWAVAILPEILVRDALAEGRLVDLAPGQTLSIALYWHCWNLESAVLETLTQALINGAAAALA